MNFFLSFFSAIKKPLYPWIVGIGVGITIGASIMAGVIWWQQPEQKLEHISRVFVALAPLHPRGVAAVGGDVAFTPPQGSIAPPVLPKAKLEQTSVPILTAKSVMVKDEVSGAVLYRKNEYARRPIASLTKLMSALVLLDGPLDWEQKIPAVNDAVADSHLLPGAEYTVDELWQTALVGSSNQAILTIVSGVSGTREEFRGQMNTKARQLGMLDAGFVEASGLDAGNVASASDVAILLGEALKHEEIKNAVNQSSYTLTTNNHKEKIWNTNWLLLRWVPHHFSSIIGGKTGYIPESGYNFAMQVEQDGRVLTVVVLGSDSNETRFTDARDIAEWVYGNYEWPSKE